MESSKGGDESLGMSSAATFIVSEHSVIIVQSRDCNKINPSFVEQENTMPAFANAARIGADVLELDVQMSRDGEVVVFHDATLGK